MNKIIALVALTLFIIALVPELGIVEQGHVINTTASTNDVTVHFILNDSKTIYIAWGSMVEYDYIKADYSGYAELPANTTMEITSDYPFEVNGSLAYIWWGSQRYVYFINFTHNTVVYINFLPKQPSNMKVLSLGQPVTNTSTSTTSLTTEMPQTQIPTEDVTIGVVSSILAVAIAIIVLARLGKKRENE